MTTQNREAANVNKRKFQDFLNFDFPNGPYTDRIRSMLERGEKRLVFNINDLRSFDPEVARNFIMNPSAYMPSFEEALKSEVSRIDDSVDANKNATEVEYFIGVEGSFGSHHVSPRGLYSSFIRRLVCVEGIVTKCSLVRPKVIKSVHYCEKTSQLHTRTYQDAFTTVGAPTSTAYPTKDENGNPLVTEYGMCVYKDSQMISIQEMPERAPPGQLPRSVDIILENDLVDKLKPGDRVQIVGIYRALASVQNGTARGVFRTMLQANSLRTLGREDCGPVLTEQDVQNIRQLGQRGDAFELISASLAPSIYGHEFIKKSLLLLLLGGVEHNLESGTHLRGDINLLMVGDPSTAKSQLLRFVLHIAPLAISTSGRGSSGVGLTAAVTSDSETGERRLEAGAMVLADRGVVCIDEFDKMSVDDRVAIHEVMEQQTVTIAKAGIHTTLNARCSVVAAANPIYGKYNKQKKPTENIGLPDSLLSRFDLLFIVLDNLNPTSDRDISDHVLRMHRYRRPGEYDGDSMRVTADTEEEETNEQGGNSTNVYQPFDRLLHGADKKRDIIAIPFIQKYILFAKNRIKPKLSSEARDFITEAYTKLRSQEDMKTLPVTPRTLETMIRLATAHARCNLRLEVLVQDAEVALDLMQYALYHDTKSSKTQDDSVHTTTTTSTTTTTADADTDTDMTDDNTDNKDKTNDEDVANIASSSTINGTGTATRTSSHHKNLPTDDKDKPDPPKKGKDQNGKGKRAATASTSTASSKKSKTTKNKDMPDSADVPSTTPKHPFVPHEDRKNEFTKSLNELFRKKKTERIALDDVLTTFGEHFSKDEVEAILLIMQEHNQVLLVDNFVIRAV
eukprot:Phypoly_transcript_02670.p1 GENE.Phypoly_transcript_02670~~Phypoly_transcript_02670.p1  ORF type:complete len:848 (-),score=98.11 Phypoly_transcript_02670:120-2663(-)